jgi:hypothetical protein
MLEASVTDNTRVIMFIVQAPGLFAMNSFYDKTGVSLD